MRQEIYNRLCCRPCFHQEAAMDTLDAGVYTPLMPECPVTVLLCDGHPLMANGLLKISNDENNIVLDGYAFEDKPLTGWYDGSNADILLLDVSMPVPNAVAIIKNLLSRFADARIIILSNEDDPGVISCMQSLGVYGYQIKTDNHKDTIQTIVKVHSGEKVFPENLDGGIAHSLIRRFIDPPDNAQLSARELQVLKLIAGGKTNPQIAAELNISRLTVKTHRQKLLQKLNACNTAQLISKARLKGVL